MMTVLHKDEIDFVHNNNLNPKSASSGLLLKLIRIHCRECVGGSNDEVRNCTANNQEFYECPFWAYRMGKNPKPSKKRQEISRKRAHKLFKHVPQRGKAENPATSQEKRCKTREKTEKKTKQGRNED